VSGESLQFVARDLEPSSGHQHAGVVAGQFDIGQALDADGRLRGLEVVPPQVESVGAPAPDSPFVDWLRFAAETGFDVSRWTPVDPERTPPNFAHTRTALKGSMSPGPDVGVRIESAAYRGRPVSFEVIGPWTRRERMAAFVPQTGAVLYNSLLLFLVAIGLGGGLYYARRNLRLGRGDRRGAARLAVGVMCLLTLEWLLSSHHVATVAEVAVFFTATSLRAAGLWRDYDGLPRVGAIRAPAVASDARVLDAALVRRLADPLVGRDVLAGCASGVLGGSLLISSFSRQPGSGALSRCSQRSQFHIWDSVR
jgi:hypothetical protein